ncbi:serine hydrolase domain-containing protein [Rossellomorea sp. NPDC077527]|uniref:serine hydrolase domain-containing protein n=1 Tax=Rossellomorea sp. NPDC077527 TaxID=3364510 RepID=UPI0037C6DE1C
MIDLTLFHEKVKFLREAHQLPGISVCLTDSSGQDFVSAAGVREYDQDIMLCPFDHQRVGSITKLVTSTLILKLQEEGRLSLDQSVESILPGILENGSWISLRQLLQHRSGLKDYIWMDVAGTKCIEHAVTSLQDHFPPQSLVRLVANHDLEVEPGTEFFYSNTGYIILGMIVEKCTGKRVKDVIDQWIIQPLQLKRTFLPSTSNLVSPYGTGHSIATPDLTDLSGDLTKITELNVSMLWTAGALISNPSEIQSFMKAVISGGLLSDGSMHQMLEFQETNDPNILSGLGINKYWFDNGLQAYGHHGGIHGYESVTLYYPEQDIFMTVIVNQMPVGVVTLAHQLFTEVCNI